MAATNQVSDPYQSVNKRSRTLVVFGLVGLALVAGFAVGKGGLLGGKSQIAGGTGGSDLSVGGEANPIDIQAGDLGLDVPLELGYDPVSPNLQLGYEPQGPSTEIGDKMPQAVREWLIHLERTEHERQRLAKVQLGNLMGMMTGMNSAAVADLTAEAFGETSSNQNYDPAKREQVAGDTKSMRQSWRQLSAFFNSKQPPAECVPIRNAYEHCLGETSAMMMDVLAQLDRAEGDPQGAINALVGMMGTSANKIDVAAKQSDGMVSQVCRKYDTLKWFSITADVGGGLGGLGLGGLGGGLGDLGGLLGGG